ncbi:MAG: hypothetical protein RSE24_01280 [Oscillospiraceae bacterium]
MKLLKLLAKFALAFLAFGAVASLVLEHSKEKYITFENDENDLELY